MLRRQPSVPPRDLNGTPCHTPLSRYLVALGRLGLHRRCPPVSMTLLYDPVQRFEAGSLTVLCNPSG